MAIWRGTVPDELLEPLDDSGWIRIFESLAAAGALASSTTQHVLDGLFVSTATTGAKATGGALTIDRTGGTDPTDLLAGATFRTDRWTVLMTTANVTLPASGSATVVVEALLQGRAGNVEADDVAPIWFTEGSFVSEDAGAQITALLTTSLASGEDPQLEALGQERSIFRQDGEEAEAYRLRVKSLPDVVTPAAVVRTVRRIMRALTGKLHPTVIMIEHFADGVVGDLDPADSDCGPETTKGNPPGALRPHSMADCRCWFTIYVEPLDETAPGMVCDVEGDEGSVDELPCDVDDMVTAGQYQLIWTAINAAKAGGVGFYLARTTDWGVAAVWDGGATVWDNGNSVWMEGAI